MANPRIPTATTRLQLPLNVASLWLALAVALLSSLMPGGLPRTTVFGSAFNPATTAVALQPTRAQPRVLADTVRRDDDPASGRDDAVRAATRSIRPAVLPATTADAPRPAAALPIEPHAGLDGSPRGPPLP